MLVSWPMEKDVWRVFKYCPRCGAPLELIRGGCGQALRCSDDGHIFYQNPHSAVSVVITNEKGECLLIRRETEPRKGDWDLPGGFVNWGEAPETAIVREVKEELGVDLHISKTLGSDHDWYPSDGLNTSVNTIIFQGTISGPIVPNKEIGSLHWLHKEELPMSSLSFNSVRTALNFVRH